MDILESTTTLLAVNPEKNQLLNLSLIPPDPEFTVKSKTKVNQIRAEVTAISEYRIDKDKDGRIGKEEDNDDDALTQWDETFDLAVVGCDNGSVCVYTVSEYKENSVKTLPSMQLLARIPLKGWSTGEISVDKGKKIAYVPDSQKGLAIVDFSLNQDNQTELIDKNNDNVDDRIIGVVDTGGASKTLLDVDEKGREVVYVENHLKDVNVVQVSCPGKDSNLVALANGKSEEIIMIEEDVNFKAYGCNLSKIPDTSFKWDFGDYNGIQVENTSGITTNATFNNIGKYAIELSCEDCNGSMNTDKVEISVVDIGLIVDYDRNRTINNDDKKIRQEGKKKTFRFWINDDDDQSDIDGVDIPGTEKPDYENSKIDGTRDLLDFFPLFIDIKSYLDVIDDINKVEVKLNDDIGSLNFVYTDFTPENMGNYLTDSHTAEFIASAETIHIQENNEVVLKKDFLNNIKEGKGILLFEGRGIPKEEKKVRETVINVEIYYNGRKQFTLKQPISLSGVEDMFRHKNLIEAGGGKPTRSPEGSLIYPDRLIDPPNNPNSSDKIFIFIHGVNVTEEANSGCMSEMFKRMFWSGSKASFYGVSWYSFEPFFPLSYGYYQNNVINAFETAIQLKEFISSLLSSGEITVAAHSLGNILVSSAINDYSADIDNYYLIDAAVALEAYNNDIDRGELPINYTVGKFIDSSNSTIIKSSMIHLDWLNKNYDIRLFASEWYRLFPESDGRSQLTWRGRFNNVPTKTKTYNFFSSGEEILAEHVGKLDPFLWRTIKFRGPYCWAAQEKLKGRMKLDFVSSTFGGWGFNESFLLIPPDAITNEKLKTKPFFKPGVIFDLYNPNTGSQYAKKEQDMLLAKMIPALTLPAGANEVPALKKNFNMNTMQNGWPKERRDDPNKGMNWLHNDYNKIAYVYVYKLFDEFVGLGQLKE